MLPEENPATKVLLAIVVGFFIIMFMDATDSENGGLLNLPSDVLLRFGTHRQGVFEPWRIIMSVFIHGGLLHILFNGYALVIIGPFVERWYGSAWTFAFFVLTGVLAAVASNQLTPLILGEYGYSVGASGALTGFIGVMTVAGHRDGTNQGLVVRSMMLRWAVFILIFGLLFPGIDNIAHIGGFVAGAALAYILPVRNRLTHRGMQDAGVFFVIISLAIFGFGIYGMLAARGVV